MFFFLPHNWHHNGVDMSTTLLLEVIPEIDANSVSFYLGGGS